MVVFSGDELMLLSSILNCSVSKAYGYCVDYGYENARLVIEQYFSKGIKFSERLSEAFNVEHFFHITHHENLEKIIKWGLLSHNKIRSLNIDISNSEIQKLRYEKKLPKVCPGTLHDYVPLFIQKMPPMLSSLRDVQNELIYLCLSTDVFVYREHSMITDGNAASNSTKFYTDMKGFLEVDWDVINSHYWGNDNFEIHNENKRKRSAEILIFEMIHFSWVTKIIVKTKDTMDIVNQILVTADQSVPIEINSGFYY